MMMMHTKVNSDQKDLSFTEWRFLFWNDKGIILDSMIRHERETKRHHFRHNFTTSWSRLDQRTYRGEMPTEIPFDVQCDAVRQLREQIRFDKPRFKVT